jgi:hypothetical protein
MNVAHLIEALEGEHVELSVTVKGKLRIVSDQDFLHSSAFGQLKNHKVQVVNHLNHEQAERLVCSLKLHDDRVFIRQKLIGIYGTKRLDIVNEYFKQWRLGVEAEPVAIKQDNAGRYRANIWIREEKFI